MGERKTAIYKTISESNGNRYRFYCDASGALACTTKEAYKADTPEQELRIAWEKEGREVFNQCHATCTDHGDRNASSVHTDGICMGHLRRV